jgi:hypothetical protein
MHGNKMGAVTGKNACLAPVRNTKIISIFGMVLVTVMETIFYE